VSADILSLPQTTSAASAAAAKGPAVSEGDDGAFGQVLAAAQSSQTEEREDVAPAKTPEPKTPEDEAAGAAKAEADPAAAGDMSAEMLAALLAQQAPQNAQTAQPLQTPDPTGSDAQAEGVVSAQTLSTPILSAKAASAATADGLAKTAQTTFEAILAGEDDLTGLDDEALSSAGEGQASPKGAQRSEAAERQVDDVLRGLSGALKAGASDASASALVAQASDTSATQISAQTATQTTAQASALQPQATADGAARLVPAASEAVQTYSLSRHTAENIAALSAQISRRLSGKTTTFDMELRPTDMGKVEVKLEIGHDGKLSAQLHFDSPVSESEFRGRQDDLRRQLEQAGFQMDDASLSFSSRDQGQGQRFADTLPGEDLPAAVEEALPEAAATEGHTLIEAQRLAAMDDEPLFYARMSAGAYGAAQALSLSVLI